MERDPDADLATLKSVHAAATAGDYARAAALAEPVLAAGLEHPLLYNVVALWREREGELDAAARLLERGVRQFPDDVGIRNAFGLCLLRLERPAEALVQFEALLASQPALPFLHASRGSALLGLGALTRAEESFKRALEFEPNHVVALAGLANIANRRGQYREGRALAERALDVVPDYPDALMSLAAAEVGAGEPVSAIPRLAALAADERLSPLERAYAKGLGGDALDALGRPAEAFAAYQRCNESLERFYRQRFAGRPSALAYVESLIGYFDAARPNDWRRPATAPEASAVRAHVFVLGFPRSGTTLLELALEGSPGALAVGETDFLVDGALEFMQDAAGLGRLRAAGADVIKRLREAYWARAAAAGVTAAGRVFIDKHPLNTLKLPLIARLFPDARVVYAYRDPRDVVLSAFRYRFEMSAVAYELLSLQGVARFYVAVMELAEHFKRVLPVALRRVRYETLVDDFDGEMRRLCEFAGIEWSPAMRDVADRTRERATATPSIAQLARGLDARGVGGWRRYRDELAPVLPLLEPWVHHMGYEP